MLWNVLGEFSPLFLVRNHIKKPQTEFKAINFHFSVVRNVGFDTKIIQIVPESPVLRPEMAAILENGGNFENLSGYVFFKKWSKNDKYDKFGPCCTIRSRSDKIVLMCFNNIIFWERFYTKFLQITQTQLINTHV